MKEWKTIREFPNYSVSDLGDIKNKKSGRVLRQSVNQYDVPCVGLFKEGEQYHRSVPLLVATAFIPQLDGVFDTPINLNGDRMDNRVGNLVWRPRWFAVKYNQQFKAAGIPEMDVPLLNLDTREKFRNSRECVIYYGLLEQDLVLSIINRTFVWPTYHQFRVL